MSEPRKFKTQAVAGPQLEIPIVAQPICGDAGQPAIPMPNASSAAEWTIENITVHNVSQFAQPSSWFYGLTDDQISMVLSCLANDQLLCCGDNGKVNRETITDDPDTRDRLHEHAYENWCAMDDDLDHAIDDLFEHWRPARVPEGNARTLEPGSSSMNETRVIDEHQIDIKAIGESYNKIHAVSWHCAICNVGGDGFMTIDDAHAAARQHVGPATEKATTQ